MNGPTIWRLPCGSARRTTNPSPRSRTRGTMINSSAPQDFLSTSTGSLSGNQLIAFLQIRNALRGQSRRSSCFASKSLLQRCQPVECSERQWTFLDRSERMLELLQRRHTDQNGTDRRMRERKPRGGFSQARGKPLLYQRHQTAGALDIGVVVHSRADRLGRRTRNWMTLG